MKKRLQTVERRRKMKQSKILSWALLVCLSLLLAIPSMMSASTEKVVHVKVEDTVEKGLLAFLERAFEEAADQGADAIILEINTPGGYTDAASKIAKLFDESPIRIIAFINKDALSAGAFLALHADEIYMVPNGTMGAAAVIDSEGNAASMKAQSAWSAQMTAAAQNARRDPLYARAMADESVDLPQYRAEVGKLLTLSASEAFEVGYSEGTVSSLNEVLENTGLQDSKVVDIEETAAEKVARFVTSPVVVPILLSIASLGLIIELFSPGFGVPGITGLASLALFFFGHLVAGFAGYESIILFVIGFALVVVELFMPGGIIGIIGAVLIVLSLLLAGANMTYMAYSIFIALIVALIGMVVIMKLFGKKMHVFNKLVLSDATTTEEGYVSNVNRLEIVGRVGKTLTPLHPAGTLVLDNERIDVVSEGGYIDAGKFVEIIKVEGSRIVVREKTEGEEK